MGKLLFTKGNNNPKTAKSKGTGWETILLHLAPARLSGYEVCGSRSTGCTIACLNTAGRGRSQMVQDARIERTKLFFEKPHIFKRQIIAELTSHVAKCDKLKVKPCCRMNATSDVVWERVWPELFTMFPEVQFYDYTKHYKRCLQSYSLPDNLHLTFSRSECNQDKCELVLSEGKVNVVVVFGNKSFPETYLGFPTYNADKDDLRFLDPNGGHVGALYAKCKAKQDTSGFVVHQIGC